jgi:hypothetical protein
LICVVIFSGFPSRTISSSTFLFQLGLCNQAAERCNILDFPAIEFADDVPPFAAGPEQRVSPALLPRH